MENTEFKKGQIVYAGNSLEKLDDWLLWHYCASDSDGMKYWVSTILTKALSVEPTNNLKYCLSVEDYHKMISAKNTVTQYSPDDVRFEDGDLKKVDDFGYELDKGYRVSYDAEGVGGFKEGFKQESEAIDYLKSNGSGGHITRVLEKLHTEVRGVKSFEIIEL